MAARVVPNANSSIVEVLNLYNYEDWSRRVKTYLIAEGLWDDVIEATPATPNSGEYRDWRMKNAKALHAIQNSCRTDVFGFISSNENAKDAWETLAKRLKPKNNRDIKGMAATLVPSEMINLEALDNNKYEHWSFWVKTYLQAENLWEVVEGTRKDPNPEDRKAMFTAWQKNNARALHVISLFCGEDAESCISWDSESAKDAWNTLAEKFKSPEISVTLAGENIEGESSEDGNSSSNDDNERSLLTEVDYNRLEQMLFKRDWDAVREFINQHPEAVRAERDWDDEFILQTPRPLHSVVYRGMVDGVKVLLPLMKKKDLDLVDDEGETPLSIAIGLNSDTNASVEIVKCIVEKNKKLLFRVVNPYDANSTIPVLYALSVDKPKMADYLYSVTPLEKLKTTDAAEIVSMSLRLKRLDIPLDLLGQFPKVIIVKDHSGEYPLIELAGTRAGLYPNVNQLPVWKRLIYHWIHIPASLPDRSTGDVSITVSKEDEDQDNHRHHIHQGWLHVVARFCGHPSVNLRNFTGIGGLYQMKLLHVRTDQILDCICEELRHSFLDLGQQKVVEKAFFQAVERGHAPFIIKIFSKNWIFDRDWFSTLTNEHGKTFFQFAAEHRQDKIFDVLDCFYSEEKRRQIIGRKDKLGNNMLHMVGKLSPLTKIDHIRGAALQMQYELQWFKKVERLASPKDLNCINSDGRTPREEFTVNHRFLVEAGEKSMKETATSSSALVAALIITIMFAAVVTVPGGNKGDTGVPIHLHTKEFKIFIVADVISLCSSTTSVMVFLGILTSRFAEEDFLTSLPTKLIVGFITLFLSIAAMMVAFSSAIVIMLRLPDNPSIVISSFVLASFPIVSFLRMQFPYLLEIIISTYGSSFQTMYGILQGWALRICGLFCDGIC